MASKDFPKNHFASAARFGDWPGLVRHLLWLVGPVNDGEAGF